MTYKNFTVETDADGIRAGHLGHARQVDERLHHGGDGRIDAIVDQTVADAAVKGVVFTSGKSAFSGGADLTMLKDMFSMIESEQRKPIRTGATQEAVRRRRPHELAVAQARDLRQAMGRRPSTAPAWAAPPNCRSPAMPRHFQFQVGENGPAGSQGRHLPGRRRHPAPAAPDQHAGCAADHDHRLVITAVARQGAWAS
jgi:hypothetical protein